MKTLVISLLAVGLVAGLVCGCQTTAKAKGPSDQELINKVVADWKAAATAKDLDKVMALYSEAFKHFEYGDKAGMKSFIKDAIDMGYMENAEVNTANMKITIEKDKANAYPIELKAAFGSATIKMALTKEAAGWKITGMDIEQS
jgi:ketosteroid isomerase-like protein